MNVTLQLRGGGSATVLEIDGDHITLASSKAAPPGSALEGDSQGIHLQVKVRGCRRDGLLPEPENFRVLGRLVSLTREARQILFGEPRTPRAPK